MIDPSHERYKPITMYFKKLIVKCMGHKDTQLNVEFMLNYAIEQGISMHLIQRDQLSLEDFVTLARHALEPRYIPSNPADAVVHHARMAQFYEYTIPKAYENLKFLGDAIDEARGEEG